MNCKKCKLLKLDGTSAMVRGNKIEHLTISHNLLNREFKLRKEYILLVYKNIIFNFVEVQNG